MAIDDGLTDGKLELFSYKFKKYLSGVSRKIRNKQLVERHFKEVKKMQDDKRPSMNDIRELVGLKRIEQDEIKQCKICRWTDEGDRSPTRVLAGCPKQNSYIAIKGLKDELRIASWYPISDGLPGDGEEVLVTRKYKDKHYIEMGSFINGEWSSSLNEYKSNPQNHSEPIAWMRLPVPYIERRFEDDNMDESDEG